MHPFEFTFTDGPQTCVVQLHGDLDVAVVPELRDELEGVLGGRCSNVVLDLADVTYADSSALGLLVWVDRRLQPNEGRLVLAGANRDVARILELSGLVNVAVSIQTSEDVGQALSGLNLTPVVTESLWSRHIDVAQDVNQLSAVRNEVSDILLPLGFPESALFDIKVALGEALANALRHGLSVEGGGRVCVDVHAFADRVIIEITDNGVGFDGATSGGDDLYAPSGRGIMFMRALMDVVEFLPGPGGGTLVRLVKHRPVKVV